MDKTSQLNFTQTLKRLEEIVAQLEKPDLDLDEGLKLLEEGTKLHKACTEKLTQAQIKIQEILKKDILDQPVEEVANI